MNKNIPWVEKYRPTDFNDVIFSETNQIIFEEIINKQYFPNMIFVIISQIIIIGPRAILCIK